jgi:hypothetical protein
MCMSHLLHDFCSILLVDNVVTGSTACDVRLTRGGVLLHSVKTVLSSGSLANVLIECVVFTNQTECPMYE